MNIEKLKGPEKKMFKIVGKCKSGVLLSSFVNQYLAHISYIGRRLWLSSLGISVTFIADTAQFMMEASSSHV
jgi:hypothetical protein